MTFYGWLREQIKRNDPVGDFARDALADSSKPNAQTEKAWILYLEKRNAGIEVIDAMQKAFKEYRSCLLQR